MVYVLTVDQRGSRRGRDLVDDALTLLRQRKPAPLLHFERTAGDEFQGVLATPEHTLDTALTLARQGTWSVGIGTGAVDEPLPTSTRSARGPAFIHARHALDTAKLRPHGVAVGGVSSPSTRDADALMALLAALISRRTDAGWDAVDLVEAGHTITEAADQLGISRQAVGQRLAVALWQQERDVRPLAIRLLEESDQTPPSAPEGDR
ncbi:hypothetical protein [Phytoactinopolyspora limicola]|uniref:hypothetical protein n=1 Tax=Phytoactinopolyspora limicola TaxID=2715536 RepID=UPI001A9CAD49|nr:hypothetical protein [Phytoactinopolyspora limicola]